MTILQNVQAATGDPGYCARSRKKVTDLVTVLLKELNPGLPVETYKPRALFLLAATMHEGWRARVQAFDLV